MLSTQSPTHAHTSSAPTLERRLPDRVPEILAPAGGRAQFFAALHSGADAVFLGMKEFNARGRAENFSFDDLRELVPLAHAYGMRVLVTINILLKEAELPRLVDDLIELEWIGVDAVIVQDLGVARLIREHFPNLRLHASTQMAVHNVHGVVEAMNLGFKRVVLARELTAQEMRLIRQKTPREEVELEAFCHGSLCYSYSGLCFFSGAADARSGNRGECAYTCRKPYKVLNEPGHGFLFSMKDLNTSDDLEKLVYAGIDTLKIEGRKKDAQYVATSVGLYRQKLDEIFKRSTAPKGRRIERDFQSDMAFSYHRDTTTFFVKGRYHENVIDLGNPTHKGQLIGRVSAVNGSMMELVSAEPLEKFDGLRIDRETPLYHAKPQHGDVNSGNIKGAQKKYANEVNQFSLRDFSVRGKKVFASKAGDKIRIELPREITSPAVGDLVYKVRSNELKRHTEEISQVPANYRLRPINTIQVIMQSTVEGELLTLTFHAKLGKQNLAFMTRQIPAQRPQKLATFALDVTEAFQVLGDVGILCEMQCVGDLEWFVPRKLIKELKADWIQCLLTALPEWKEQKRQTASAHLDHDRQTLAPVNERSYQIKCDRLETVTALESWCEEHPEANITEIVFEPKRAFLGQVKADVVIASLATSAERVKARLRLSIPTVLRAWDEPFLTPWIHAMNALEHPAFEVGNIGAFELLRKAGVDCLAVDVTSDFSLYSLNTEAVRQWGELGCNRVALSIEDDEGSLVDKLQGWPNRGPRPQAIIYKDTPLFIAEACSLTALHHGCPTAKVCGYRTLEIENDGGERFFVAHESCKSIVYGAEAYSISQYQSRLMKAGVDSFRIDFLTRNYNANEIAKVLSLCLHQQAIPATHPANFLQRLL